MKIILSNYRYFMSGGPEKYLFAIQSMLRNAGHEVVPFSVKSSKNLPCDHQDRFLSPIGDEDAVYAHEYRRTPGTILKFLARQYYDPEAFFKARSFAKDIKPDLVYSLQFLNKMSPAVLDGFHSTGHPVVLRISDFGLICPQAHMFDGQQVCDACVKGNFLHPIARRCIKGSAAAGMIKGSATMLHRLLRCRDRIDAYAFPSRYTMKRFAEAGFPEDRLHYLPTFIETPRTPPSPDRGETILYFGRVVQEKGVHQLIEAWDGIPGDKPKLVVIGAQEGYEYADRLIAKYGDRIEFHSFIANSELASYIARAICVVVPSVWYDNQPNVVLETYSQGKPIIAPDHGCFPDLVQHSRTGFLYEATNVESLREHLRWAMEHPAEMAEMGLRAFDFVRTDFTPQRHYETLMRIFQRASS